MEKKSIPIVNSYNEWDPLEEVIVLNYKLSFGILAFVALTGLLAAFFVKKQIKVKI